MKDYVSEVTVMEPETILGWKWFDINQLPENMYKPSKVIVEKYKTSIVYE